MFALTKYRDKRLRLKYEVRFEISGRLISGILKEGFVRKLYAQVNPEKSPCYVPRKPFKPPCYMPRKPFKPPCYMSRKPSNHLVLCRGNP